MIRVSRVGHATFETPDLDRAIAYYTDVNGLVLSAKDKDRAFLASKTGLLTIALVQGREQGLRRISFEVAANADFSDMTKKLSAEGVRSEQQSEQDQPDRKIELLLEFGYDPRSLLRAHEEGAQEENDRH